MRSLPSVSGALAQLTPEPGLVLLMRGVAGSGKTTFSRHLEAHDFVRISIDEVIWSSSGRYGLDYPPEAYGEKVSAARDALKDEVARLLSEKRSVVVDSAFWSREHRQAFATLVALKGGYHRIIYLKAEKVVLRSRLEQRRSRFDANAALPIDDQMLDRFMETFEEPSPDEGALIVAA